MLTDFEGTLEAVNLNSGEQETETSRTKNRIRSFKTKSINILIFKRTSLGAPAKSTL